MKFKDVRTINHLLKEYGMTPGAPTSVGSQKTGSIVNKSSTSPTIQGKKQEPKPIQVKKVEKDSLIIEPKTNKELGKVVSPVGDKPVPDAVVVQNQKGEYNVVKGDQQVIVKQDDNDVEEGKLSNLAKHKNKKLGKIKDLKSRIKKLSRRKLTDEYDPNQINEINYNDRRVSQEALDLPIKCGFEAETFFTDVYADESSSRDTVDEMSIADVENSFGDLPSSAYEQYEDWVREVAMDDYMPDVVENWVEENRDDDEMIDEFKIAQGITDEAVEKYKQEFEEMDPDEYENREEDGWDNSNWLRDLINEEYDIIYADFLKDIAYEDDDLIDIATDEARDENSMDEWVSNNFYSMSEFLDDFGVDYYLEDDDDESGVRQVADKIYDWATENSKFDGYPYYGGYHGSDTDYTRWAVETDSTISADSGSGAEIISPAFSSPRQMLEEMSSLFSWAEDEFGTNSSTGLHITMSWNGDSNIQPNKAKMAVLLGDEYLLKVFGRHNNTYAKSTAKYLRNNIDDIKVQGSKSLEPINKQLNKILASNSDRYQAINLRSRKDDESGNHFVEFRIAGGQDYEKMFKEVRDAVVRYATVMKAGHTNDYHTDYVKALIRIVNQAKDISSKDREKLVDFERELDSHPLLDTVQRIASKRAFRDALDLLGKSLINKRQGDQLSKATSPEMYGKASKGGPRDKRMYEADIDYAEPKTASSHLKYDKDEKWISAQQARHGESSFEAYEHARDYFAQAMGVLAQDIANGTAKRNPSVKDINNLRTYAQKELGLSYEKLEELIMKNLTSIFSLPSTNPNALQKSIYSSIRNGVSALLKKEVLGNPEFIDKRRLDKIINGLWNFMQSDEVDDNTEFYKVIKYMDQINPNININDITYGLQSLKKVRQKNEFYRNLVSGGYDIRTPFLKSGNFTDGKALKELEEYLDSFEQYPHPTGREHHVNIRSDDRYEQVALNNLVQLLRSRLSVFDDQEISEEDQDNLRQQLCKMGQELLEKLKPVDDDQLPERDGKEFLSLRNLDVWNDAMDKIVGLYDKDNTFYNFVPAYDDVIFSIINNIEQWYSYKENYPNVAKNPDVKKLVAERFKAIKKYLNDFDKIFQKQGFTTLKSEIASKNVLDRRNKDFEKNYRQKSVAKVNIPSFSYVYMDKEYYESLLDNPDMVKSQKNIIENPNSDNKFYVIPAAHMSQAEDAYTGLEFIKNGEAYNMYYNNWRKEPYQRILNKWKVTYGESYDRITNASNKTYFQLGGDNYEKLKQLGIEITRKGDSRTGMAGQKDLIPRDTLANPKSGEPLDRGSAGLWMNDDDEKKEKLRFKAFDWSLYPPEIKPLVAKELATMKDREGYYGFQQALNTIVIKSNNGETGITLNSLDNTEGLINAAEVDGYRKDHSAKIGAETNWSNLADYLKLERGVNDQGVDLLRQTYDMFDNNASGQFAADGVSIERWVDAVQKSYKYITTNYTVSGGNYFRGKDYIGARHGGPDSVSKTISTPPEKEYDTDYNRARSSYTEFDQMMHDGMQNYLERGQVNDLVAFLNNPRNDETFKNRVLYTMKQNYVMGEEPFPSFNDVLTTARENYQESVFDKFDKLSLQEKLSVLEKSTVLEKWSKKYKDSINCSNPKGFSQKAHCAGKKKTESSQYVHFLRPGELTGSWTDAELLKLGFKKAQNGNWYIANSKWNKLTQMGERNWRKLFDSIFESIGPKVSEGPISESLPDNSIPGLLNQILAEPMPAWDLKKQFLAYYAVPDPQMLTDFRARRAEGGNNACLRSVLRHYIKKQLHPQLQKKINLNESVIKEYEDLSAEKEKIIDIIKDLDISDNKDRAIVDQIWRILNSDHIQEIIGNVIARPIADETAMNKAEATKVLTKVIYQVESEYDKIKEFLDTLEETGSAYDVDALKSTLGNVRSAFVSDVAYTVFKTLLPYGSGSNKKGPGEFALAMLSDRVRLSDTTGDIVMDDELVELKVSKSETASSGGRLGMNGISQNDARDYIEQYREMIPTVMAHLDNPSNKSLGFPKFIEYLNIDLPIGDKRRYNIAKGFYSKIFSEKSAEFLARSIMSDDPKTIIDKYYIANFNDYKTKGKFNSLLAIDIATNKTMFVDDVTDLVKLRNQGFIGSPSLSFVPTQAGPTEVFVQMSFTKK